MFPFALGLRPFRACARVSAALCLEHVDRTGADGAVSELWRFKRSWVRPTYRLNLQRW